MDINIRSYTTNDIDELVPLIISFQNYLTDIDTTEEVKKFEDKEDAKNYLLQLVKDAHDMNGVFLVALHKQNIIGFIQGVVSPHNEDILHNLTHYPSKDGWIGVLFVSEEFRGKGVSSLLYEKILQDFKSKNCTRVKLLVSNDNTHAQKVYKKYSFSINQTEMTLRLK